MSRPTRYDVVLAAVVTVGALVEALLGGYEDRGLLALGGGVAAVALAARRVRPLLVLGVVLTAFTGTHAATLELTELATGTVPLLVACYTASALLRLGPALAAGLAALACAEVTVLLGPDAADAPSALYAAAAVGVAWSLGRVVAARHEHVRLLEQRAALLEAQQQAREREAVAVERSRLARELHDVVAHGVSLMVVQAGAAEGVLADRPEAAAGAMREVQQVGRQSLGELRRMLGLLREEDDAPDRHPQPGLADVPVLVATVREAGLEVALDADPVPADLPAAVSLSAYRIVQEALTNALKHAGGAPARVAIRCTPAEVAIEVADDGPEVGSGAGHGLLGMRERVALFGGTLSVSRPGEHGFVVRARLPVEGAS